MLPNFIVIGAAKAGTTALYWYLADHPQVFVPKLKETNFFAYGVDGAGRLLYGDPDLHRFPITSLHDYELLFAEANGADAVGEASPIYLECPQAAERIRDLIPEVRIVCGLRDPVDRAYSDYLMYLRSRKRRFDPQRDLTPGAPWMQPTSHWMQIGRYHELLSPYFAAFRRDQIHIFLFDDFKRSALDVTRGIYRFLGVDSSFVPDLETPHNTGGVPASMLLERLLTSRNVQRSLTPVLPRGVSDRVRRARAHMMRKAPPLPHDLRRNLARHFEDDVKKTSALIGRDLGHWL